MTRKASFRDAKAAIEAAGFPVEVSGRHLWVGIPGGKPEFCGWVACCPDAYEVSYATAGQIKFVCSNAYSVRSMLELLIKSAVIIRLGLDNP